MNTLGFIGMGNMAQALAAGFIRSGKLTEKIRAYAPNREKLCRNAERMGFIPCNSLIELADSSDTLIMACKPYQIEGVLKELGDHLNGKALISICAGWSCSRYKGCLDPSVRFQFVMPNTPAMVGEGVLLFEKENSLRPEEREEILALFGSVGQVEEMPGHLMDAAGAITGCGPAFADLFMEAYADAAVKYGIPREAAYRLVSQTLLGSASLQKKTGEHPAVLKDKVCSPAGTTIRGVASLEEDGFRSACIHSIDAIMNFKSRA